MHARNDRKVVDAAKGEETAQTTGVQNDPHHNKRCVQCVSSSDYHYKEADDAGNHAIQHNRVLLKSTVQGLIGPCTKMLGNDLRRGVATAVLYNRSVSRRSASRAIYLATGNCSSSNTRDDEVGYTIWRADEN